MRKIGQQLPVCHASQNSMKRTLWKAKPDQLYRRWGRYERLADF